nr:glycosyl hydrolase family 28 protein [Catelliglobosispora koreensis]
MKRRTVLGAAAVGLAGAAAMGAEAVAAGHETGTGLAAGDGLAGQGPAGTGEAAAGQARGVMASAWDEVPAILARIVPPTFAARTFDIRDYGAVGNNSTDCTAAFRNAINACTAAGGGRVLVTSGTYRTGKIELKSNVELHVTSGATIRFRTDTGSYLPPVFTRWQGIECYNHSPFIYANGLTNVGITGAGTIDGNAPAGSWSGWGGGGADWTKLQDQGRTNVPVSQRVYGAGTKLRPNMIGLYNCTNVLIDGVFLRHPAMWTLHPVYCTNITVRNVTFYSTNSQGDGLDLDSCTDAYVTGCRMDTNDDCVVIKSGRDTDGRRVGRPMQNVVVENCKFSGRWGGITVGSEMSGGASKIFAQDCQNNPADFPGRYPIKYPLYVKTNKQRGGTIDGVHLRRIHARNIERDGLHITTVYNGTTSGSFIPVLRDFTCDQLTVVNGRSAVSFEGQSDVRIQAVEISNSTFTGMTAANVIEFTDVHWINSSINGVPIGDPPPAGTRYEAENAFIGQGVVESNHAGYSGTGFVNGDNVVGSFVEWTVTAAATGSATVRIRYANGTTANRPMNVNGLITDFAGTGAWTTWQTKTLTLNLTAGSNVIRATATTSNGGPNLDYLDVSQ